MAKNPTDSYSQNISPPLPNTANSSPKNIIFSPPAPSASSLHTIEVKIGSDYYKIPEPFRTLTKSVSNDVVVNYDPLAPSLSQVEQIDGDQSNLLKKQKNIIPHLMRPSHSAEENLNDTSFIDASTVLASTYQPNSNNSLLFCRGANSNHTAEYKTFISNQIKKLERIAYLSDQLDIDSSDYSFESFTNESKYTFISLPSSASSTSSSYTYNPPLLPPIGTKLIQNTSTNNSSDQSLAASPANLRFEVNHSFDDDTALDMTIPSAPPTPGRLSRQQANFTPVPQSPSQKVSTHKPSGSYDKNPPAIEITYSYQLRVITYNITCSFNDKDPSTDFARHNWSNRKEYVEQLLDKTNPDVMCLQELSVGQAKQLLDKFGQNYQAVFLAQTPTKNGIPPTGAIAENMSTLDEWAQGDEWGNNPPGTCKLGTPMVGIFVQNNLRILSKGRFWLNENPDQVPVNTDRAETDKGFGNMNTYRATLWVKLQDTNGKVFYVFNSHYPLNGTNDTRLNCAKTEMEQIKKIAQNNDWFAAGDRNLLPDPSLDDVYDALTKDGVHDCRDSEKGHFGVDSTFYGFSYDKHKFPIYSSDPAKKRFFDGIFSNIKAKISFINPGAFNPATKQIIELDERTQLLEAAENYNLASDHGLLGADWDFSTFASDHGLVGADWDSSTQYI